MYAGHWSGDGASKQPGVVPPLMEPTLRVSVASAACHLHRMLLLTESPLIRSLSPPPRPAPPLSVRDGTGKEDGHRVSGSPGRMLGRPLLLLPPGHLGLSGRAPSAPSGPAAFCYCNKQLVLDHSIFFFV